LSEDEEKDAADQVQKMTDDFTRKIDAAVEKKHTEILTI
jgi:ribosome recycling factor